MSDLPGKASSVATKAPDYESRHGCRDGIVASNAWMAIVSAFFVFWCGLGGGAGNPPFVAGGAALTFVLSGCIAWRQVQRARPVSAAFDLYALSLCLGLVCSEWSTLQQVYSTEVLFGDAMGGAIGAWRLLGVLPLFVGAFVAVDFTSQGYRFAGWALCTLGVGLLLLPMVPGWSVRFIAEPVALLVFFEFIALYLVSSFNEGYFDTRKEGFSSRRCEFIALLIGLWSVGRFCFFPNLGVFAPFAWDSIFMNAFGLAPAVVATLLLVAALIYAQRDFVEESLACDWGVPLAVTGTLWIGMFSAQHYLPFGRLIAALAALVLLELCLEEPKLGLARRLLSCAAVTALACLGFALLPQGAYMLFGAILLALFMMWMGSQFYYSSLPSSESGYKGLLVRLVAYAALIAAAALPTSGFSVARLAFLACSALVAVVALYLTIHDTSDAGLRKGAASGIKTVVSRVRAEGLGRAFAKAGMFKIRLAMALGFCLLMACTLLRWNSAPTIDPVDDLAVRNGVALVDAGRQVRVEFPASEEVKEAFYRVGDVGSLTSTEALLFDRGGATQLDLANPVITLDQPHVTLWVSYADGTWALAERWIDLSHQELWAAQIAGGQLAAAGDASAGDVAAQGATPQPADQTQPQAQS